MLCECKLSTAFHRLVLSSTDKRQQSLKSIFPTPQNLDPFDIMGWDMLEEGKRQLRPSSPLYFTDHVLDMRSCSVSSVILQAENATSIIPYSQGQLI